MVANLKKLRKEHGYSQKALADLLGITQQAVYKYENLSVEPDIRTLICLADIFNVSVDYLIGRESETVTRTVEITADDIMHLQIWRKLPRPLRSELDGLIQKYNITPADSATRIGGTFSEVE